jgi:hypothetical protein
MITKRYPKVILEGTRLTSKTDLAFALNEHPRIVGVRKYRYHSPIVSGEWNGFTDSPYGASLINFEPQQEQPGPGSLRNVGQAVRTLPILFLGRGSFSHFYAGLAVDLCEAAPRLYLGRDTLGDAGISAHILLATSRLIRRSSKTTTQNLKQSFAVQ